MRDNYTKVINYTSNKDYINNKYFENVKKMFYNYVDKYIKSIYKLEELYGKDDLEVKIESIDKLSLIDIETYYTSLFDANSTQLYLLSIKKIVEFLSNCKLKELVNLGQKKQIELIDYNKIENYIENKVSCLINDFNFNSKFKYELIKTEINEPQEDQIIRRLFGNIEIINEEKITTLIDLVILKMHEMDSIINTYGLLSVQQVDFSLDQYIAIKDCFVKIKNSKITKVNIDDLINLLNKVDTKDFDDIFSENYVTFVAVILELSYFLCNYFIEKNDMDLKSKRTTHKNESELEQYICDNIELYFDKINQNFENDFLNTYIKIYNIVNKLSYDDLIKELKEC